MKNAKCFFCFEREDTARRRGYVCAENLQSGHTKSERFFRLRTKLVKNHRSIGVNELIQCLVFSCSFSGFLSADIQKNNAAEPHQLTDGKSSSSTGGSSGSESSSLNMVSVSKSSSSSGSSSQTPLLSPHSRTSSL